MKTAFLVPTYLRGCDISGSCRNVRQLRWLEWHEKLDLGIDRIFFSDNDSGHDDLGNIDPDGLARICSLQRPGINFIHHAPRLFGSNGGIRYPFNWRHLYAMGVPAQDFDKVIFCDSDTFVLTQKLVNFVRELRSGWTAFHEQKHNFPTAEFHVLCADAFWIFKEFTGIPYMAHMGKTMETSIPFTDVREDFFVRRTGEEQAPQAPGQDLYCQARLDIPLTFS